jgi:hypothetical protein
VGAAPQPQAAPVDVRAWLSGSAAAYLSESASRLGHKVKCAHPVAGEIGAASPATFIRGIGKSPSAFGSPRVGRRAASRTAFPAVGVRGNFATNPLRSVDCGYEVDGGLPVSRSRSQRATRRSSVDFFARSPLILLRLPQLDSQS